ncbi:squamous cell carcinoma antigen recognized by T-cells 3 [Penaeus vannamei]|uniref:squamous cell carcinoma antigen recognized by T-cells 3 n=1 Tax=Penaeus vannamei TaxID=6689 RepID=UPI00387F53E4
MSQIDDEMADEQEEMLQDSSGDGSSDEDDDDMNDQREGELRMKVEEIRKQLDGNELYYDGHVNLITVLRELMELEEARKAREKMSEVYPLTPELWLDWIRDEQKICSTPEEREYIINLFERAVKDYTSVQVWMEYVMFMLGGGDYTATRAVGEKALTAVGTHVAEGLLVWQVVLLVEKQIYSGLQRPGTVQSEEDMKAQEKQQKRIQGLYRRLIRVPLLNADYQHLMEEAAEFFEGDFDVHMKADLEKTKQKLNEKIPFEEKLLQAENDTNKLATYRLYIQHLQENDNPAAVQSLYERAVLDHCLDASLWEEYVKFVIRQFPGLDYLVLPICERSQRNCPWSAALCELHISALQLFHVGEETKTLMKKVKGALEKGLGSGLQSGSEATRMWMAYLVFQRRLIKWDQEHAAELDALRESGQQAITMIDSYFGESGDIESEIPRFFARIEAEFAKNMERAREIWNDIIMRRNNNFKNVSLWLEFINLERCYGTEKHCRKLFRRALERVWDWVESIGSAYLRFEQETGTIESMEEFQKRYEDRMFIVNKKRAEDAAKLGEGNENNQERRQQRDKGKRQDKKRQAFVQAKETENFKAPHPVSKYKQDTQNRKVGTSHEGSNGNDAPQSVESAVIPRPPGFKDIVTPPPGFKSDVPPPPGFKDTITPPPGFKDTVTPPPGFKGSSSPPPGYTGSSSKAGKREREDYTDTEPELKKLKVAELHGVRVKEDDSEDLCTVFLSNLDFSVGKEEVVPIFTNCGEVKDFRLVKDYKCRSKGFGYLVFKTQSAAADALKYDRTAIKGRPMYVSAYDPEGHTNQFKYSTGLEREKVFIRGLPFSLTEEKIKEHFMSHGEIKEIRLVTYRNGHSKGLCYLTYPNAETAEKVVKAMDGTEIEGKIISVMISDPSNKKKPNEGNVSTTSAVKNSEKKVPGSRGKGMFNLMPRSLMRATTSTAGPTSSEPETPVKPKSNEDFRKMFLK